MDTPAIEGNGRRPRIGVVDDDAGVTELLAGVLEARGWAVRVGASIAAARALVDEGLDVLLIDLWLPDGTGVDVARETAGHRDPPEVVIMTAEATLESAVQTVSTGASEYLLKPLDLARLRELLEALLERRRRRELRERATVALRGQRREARRREAAQYGVARILAEAITLEDAAAPLLRMLAHALGFDAARLSVVDGDGATLRVVDVWRRPSLHAAGLTRPRAFARGEAVAGRVWAARTALWIVGAEQAPDLRRAGIAAGDGVEACLGVPLALGEEIFGVVELFRRSGDAPAPGLLAWVATLGSQIAQFTERKRSEARLREANAALEAILQSSPAAIVVVDLERRVTGWNKTAERVFGWAAAEVLGRVVPMVPESEREPSVRAFERWVGGEVTVDVEVVRRRRDGTPVHVSRSGGPLLDASGRVVGVVSAMVDITDRKRSEAALEDSNARFAAVFEQAAVGIGVCDLDGRWLQVNQRLCAMVGYTADDLRERSFLDMTHPDDRRTNLAYRDEMVRGERAAYTMEKRYLHKNGAVVPVEVTVSIVRDASGRPGYSIAIVQDVSARAAALAALRRSEARLRATFEQAAVGITIVTDDGRFVAVNQRFADIVGYPVDELAGMRFEDVTHPDDLVLNAERRRPMVAHEAQTYSIEKRYLRRDGAVVWAHVTASQAREASGESGYSIGIVQDITERKQLEQELRHAQRMEGVGQLAGGIAHDFNNLLTVISGRSQLGFDRLHPADPVRHDLDLIHKTAERAAGLTRQLLAFSRKQVLQPKVIALDELVTGLAGMLKRLIGDHIELTLDAAVGAGRVRVDPGQLEQVVVNLAVNARDAMPDGGQLTIAVDNAELDAAYAARRVDVTAGPHVVLSVRDTGTGMPPEVQARIFEPFFTTKGPGRGTGLGLATVYGIVKQSGGHLAVESAPGAGTTFRVYLPRTDEALAAEAARAAGTLPRGDETVLLVEDEPEVRDLAQEMLERLGYTVLAAAAPADALLIAQRHVGIIDLLLTDVIMPRMSGAALAQLIAAERPETAILFMSGYTDDLIARHGVLESDAELLEKPFAPPALAGRVREVIDRHRAGR